MSQPALSTHGLGKRYGAVVAVDDVTISVGHGERRALIGPNGAGKSTLFGLIAGTLRPTAGTVELMGRDITRLTEYRRARAGLVKTFQHSSVFSAASLLDNVILGTTRMGGRPARPFGRHSRAVTDAARETLRLVGLAGREHVLAGSLSHGERRQLDVALALSVAPTMLLLDEPTAGMSAAETARFVDLVAGLPRDITVLIIEHDLDVVFTLADKVTVLHLGSVIEDGSPDQVRASELVQRVYLGVDPEDAFPPAASEVPQR